MLARRPVDRRGFHLGVGRIQGLELLPLLIQQALLIVLGRGLGIVRVVTLDGRVAHDPVHQLLLLGRQHVPHADDLVRPSQPVLGLGAHLVEQLVQLRHHGDLFAILIRQLIQPQPTQQVGLNPGLALGQLVLHRFGDGGDVGGYVDAVLHLTGSDITPRRTGDAVDVLVVEDDEIGSALGFRQTKVIWQRIPVLYAFDTQRV